MEQVVAARIRSLEALQDRVGDCEELAAPSGRRAWCSSPLALVGGAALDSASQGQAANRKTARERDAAGLIPGRLALAMEFVSATPRHTICDHRLSAQPGQVAVFLYPEPHSLGILSSVMVRPSPSVELLGQHSGGEALSLGPLGPGLN